MDVLQTVEAIVIDSASMEAAFLNKTAKDSLKAPAQKMRVRILREKGQIVGNSQLSSFECEIYLKDLLDVTTGDLLSLTGVLKCRLRRNSTGRALKKRRYMFSKYWMEDACVKKLNYSWNSICIAESMLHYARLKYFRSSLRPKSNDLIYKSKIKNSL